MTKNESENFLQVKNFRLYGSILTNISFPTEVFMYDRIVLALFTHTWIVCYLQPTAGMDAVTMWSPEVEH